MARSKLRTLKLSNKPYGKFDYVVHLTRRARIPKYAKTNAGEIEKIRHLTKNTFQGPVRFKWVKNHDNRRVYTHIYISHSMDLAMLKLVFSDSIHKIYKVIIDAAEPPLDLGQKTDAV